MNPLLGHLLGTLIGIGIVAAGVYTLRVHLRMRALDKRKAKLLAEGAQDEAYMKAICEAQDGGWVVSMDEVKRQHPEAAERSLEFEDYLPHNHYHWSPVEVGR